MNTVWHWVFIFNFFLSFRFEADKGEKGHFHEGVNWSQSGFVKLGQNPQKPKWTLVCRDLSCSLLKLSIVRNFISLMCFKTAGYITTLLRRALSLSAFPGLIIVHGGVNNNNINRGLRDQGEVMKSAFSPQLFVVLLLCLETSKPMINDPMEGKEASSQSPKCSGSPPYAPVWPGPWLSTTGSHTPD